MLCEKWIWLPEDKYPERQVCCFNDLGIDRSGKYTVAEFRKQYKFDKKIAAAKLRFSADTAFHLYINGALHATGPASPGGDFLCDDRPRSNFYSYETELEPDSDRLDFFARVRMKPERGFEFSVGHGGFMLTAILTFDDGTKTVIHTDKSWSVRPNAAYIDSRRYDSSVAPDEYVSAQEIRNLWHTRTAPIPVSSEQTFSKAFSLEPNEEKELTLELDRIYAGYVYAAAETHGKIEAEIICRETDETGSSENICLDSDSEYRGFYMHSAGKLVIKAKNRSSSPSTLNAGFIAACYPVCTEAVTLTSDGALNQVLDTCRHTLKYCRQTLHLDSPKHCEPLACTGDYYIESLMTAFSFGDMRLAEFDILRTAELIRNNGGRMFHTTYSLIWVRMLLDVYRFTANRRLLEECEDALIMLLDLFKTYIGGNGLIETPPDFMFVDWIYIDSISMHHPPKALGQTCLNMFYFGALGSAAEIYEILGEAAMAEDCLRRRETLRAAVISQLFDREKGLCFEGLNTPSEVELGQWMPQNVEKRYYLKQSNILAAYFGIFDENTSRDIIHKIMNDECPGDYQPYFAHYLLEAIYSNGLRDKYTLEVLERWKKPVAECPKGLVEGFIAPEPTYSFDHSHAWGGTPLWSLPKALIGLGIIKPGFEEISLSPSLLGLESARVELPTPYGLVTVEMKSGEPPLITHPDGVKVTVK